MVLSMQAASKATPEAPSTEGRLWQHVAMGVAVVQFALPDFQITGFNGNLFVYIHFFRQIMAIGFASTLSRRTVDAVVTRIWPIAFTWMFGAIAPSSFFLGGIISYPWLPHFMDRLNYMTGTALVIGIMDRLGKIIGEAGLLLELPGFIGNSTLTLYLVHPLFIVAFAQLPGITSLSLFFLAFAVSAGSWGIASWLRGPTWERRSPAFCLLIAGLAGFVVSVALITLKVAFAWASMLCILYAMFLYWAVASSADGMERTKYRTQR